MSEQYPQYPAPRKSSAGKIALIVIGLVLLVCSGLGIAAIAGVGGAASVVEQESTDRSDDLTITKCDTSELGLVEISYTIVNSSSTVARTYLPQFTMVTNDGTIVGSAADVTAEIPPGGTFKGKAVGTIDDSAKRLKFTCKSSGA
jgi:hypothetical protein